MNSEYVISIFAGLLGAAGFAVALVCLALYRKTRNTLESAFEQIAEFENTLARQNDFFEDGRKRAGDQARRIAWLETRIRKPQKTTADIADEVVLTPATATSSPLNLTERRHRVLKLAAGGQSVEMISSTLGMLSGEVELIINLNRNAANFA